MTQRFLAILLLAVAGTAWSKLPPPDDAAKAKAAEASARAAWQAKVDAFQLCKAQDRVVAQYKGGGKAAGKPADAKAVPVATKQPASPAPQAAAAGTPAAAAPPGPCSDPGPFAYAPPDQKPLETSGAHSPAPTAASPPSVRPEAATMTPAKPSTAPGAAAPGAKP